MSALRFYASGVPEGGSSLGRMGSGGGRSQDPRNPNKGESRRLTIGQAIGKSDKAVQLRTGEFRGVLQTWIDLNRELDDATQRARLPFGDPYEEAAEWLKGTIRFIEKTSEFEEACTNLEADLKRRGV